MEVSTYVDTNGLKNFKERNERSLNCGEADVIGWHGLKQRYTSTSL